VENSDLFYKKFIAEKRAWYKTIGKCFCPVLKEDVVFNSKGFRHLLYNGLGRARSNKERVYRLKLLPLVVPIIRTIKVVAEYKKSEHSVSLEKDVEYWMLQTFVGKGNHKVSIILRRIGSGKVTFYSVWKK
jgi:hypothetical protein